MKWKLVPVDVVTSEMVAAGIATPVANTGNDDVDRPEDYKQVFLSMLAAAPTPAPSVSDNVASEPVGYLYTNMQSGEYHVSDADDDYRGPERALWCIEPVYRRAKGQL